jgi:glucosamine-6-phosphate deaminase
MSQVKELKADKLKVKIYETRLQMGASAAHAVADRIEELLLKQDFVNMIFAAAPSQNEFLSSLRNQPVQWNRVNAFHMDEYVGLGENAPQRFGLFLKERIFDKVPFHEVHYLDGNNPNINEECKRYAQLLQQYPTDIVCMGIGENAHVAFNDPHDADFNDPLMVKLVTLDEVSRRQQVHDGCFARLEDVPESAITLTVPSLLRAKRIFCIVPGNNKAQAVYHSINSKVSETFPSTALREHNNAILYLDKDSATRLNN